MMQKPKIPSPSLDLEMSGEKLMHDTLHIPDGIDAVFDAIVAQVAENLAKEAPSTINTVVLSGVGDIYHASLSTECAFERLTGIRTIAMPSMRLGLYGSSTLPRGTVVTQGSYSGRPDRVVETAGLTRVAGARVWAITLDDTSPLAQASDLCFGKVSSAEANGIGFQLVTLILLLIGTRLGEIRGTLTPARAEALRGMLRASTGDMRRTLGASLEPVRRLAERFVDAGHVLFLGSGPSYGTAVNGSARILEAVGWNASAQDIEEWAHLDRWASDRVSPSVLIVPPGPSRHRAIEIARAMGRLHKPSVAVAAASDTDVAAAAEFVLPVESTLPEEFSPLVYNLPGEMLANQLSIITRRRPYRQEDSAYRQLGEVRWGGTVLTRLPAMLTEDARSGG
jgi:glucosamine--fructose-6-phosphate aminotransferase (isomerizing)